jgi:hypothetical protein
LSTSDAGAPARVPTPIRKAAPRQILPDDVRPKAWITIGKERTYVTQPVDADGYIDYLAALNAAASEGVTVENNAAVLLVRAMDLSALDPVDREHFYKLLGIDRLQPVAGCFDGNSAFLKNQNDHFGETLASVVPWSADEFVARARWLRIHEKALDLVVEATRRTHCYFPLVRPANVTRLHEMPAPGLDASNEIAQALTARALLRIHDGKLAEARQDLLACHRLSRLVGCGPCLFHGSVGRSIEIKACLADVALLEPGRLNSAEAMAYRNELRKLPPLPSVAQLLDRGERLLFLSFLTELAQKQRPEFEELIDDLFFSLVPFGDSDLFHDLMTDLMIAHWDDTLEAANADWDRWVAAVRAPIAAGRQKAVDGLHAESSQIVKQTAEAIGALPNSERGRALGRWLVAKLLPAFQGFALVEDRTQMRADLVQLGLSLAAYHADRGSYPTTLEALVPKYCSEVPLDRFTAKPLRYLPREDGYLLYSVGENATDDGARTSDFRPPGDDIVLEVGRKSPVEKPSGLAPEIALGLMTGAAALLLLATYGGFTTTVTRLCRLRRVSKWLALVHGAIAVIALLLLIAAVATLVVPTLALASLGLLLMTAAGGAWMYVAVHRRQRRLPILLVLGHAALALSAVSLLFFAIFRFEPCVRARQVDPLRPKWLAPGQARATTEWSGRGPNPLSRPRNLFGRPTSIAFARRNEPARSIHRVGDHSPDQQRQAPDLGEARQGPVAVDRVVRDAGGDNSDERQAGEARHK